MNNEKTCDCLAAKQFCCTFDAFWYDETNDMFLQVCFKEVSFNCWINTSFFTAFSSQSVQNMKINKKASKNNNHTFWHWFGHNKTRQISLFLSGKKKRNVILKQQTNWDELLFKFECFYTKTQTGRGESQTDSQQDGTKQTKNKRKSEWKSIANGIGIRFIPKRQQQKAGRKAGWFLRPVFPFPWLWKETWHEVEGQAKRRQHCVETVTHRHLFWHAQARLLSVVHANWRAQAVI